MISTAVAYTAIPSPEGTVVLNVGLLGVIALVALGSLLVVLLRGGREKGREARVDAAAAPSELRVGRAA